MPVGIVANTIMSGNRGEQHGHTLLEVLIVVSLLAVIAAVAAPSFTNTDESKLDAAVIEVTSAIRFAQSEAVRTGVPRGVYAGQSDQQIRVYRLPAAIPIYDVYDPLNKNLYDLNFSAGGSDVAIDNVYFKFENFSFPRDYLGFSGGTGLPKYNDFGTVRMLETAYVRLDHNGAQRTIAISPMTGRVTVQ